MAQAVEDFNWPQSIVNMPDEDGGLWSHFGVRFRGTWVLLDRDGRVVERTSPHPPDLLRRLDRLVSA